MGSQRVGHDWATFTFTWAFLVAQTVKNPPAMQETWVWSLGWEDPWRREWLPSPVFWPGEFHGQRSLPGYSQWGRKESDMTEWLSLSTSTTFMDCSLPSSSVRGISQARILEWVAISFSLGLNPRLLRWQVASLPLNHQGHLWGIRYSACQILWNLLTEEHRNDKPAFEVRVPVFKS